MNFARALTAVVLTLASPLAFAANGTIEGTLRERGTKLPLEGVNVYALPGAAAPAAPDAAAATSPAVAPLKAVTDAAGHFTIEGIPPGPFRWVVNLTGYEKLELEDLSPGADAPRYLYLEKTSYQAYETTIYGKGDKRDEKT